MNKIPGKKLIIALVVFGILFSIALRWILNSSQKTPINIMTFPANIDLEPTPEQLYYGKVHYKIRCSKCHGINFSANNDSEFPIQTTKSKQALYSIIYYGIPNTNMKGWGKKLQPQDILAIVYYLKSFNKEKTH